MKTNQLMTVALSKGAIAGFHKTDMVSLTDVFRVGNAHRACEGKTAANMTKFLQSSATSEFIGVICNNQNITIDEVIVKKGKGKNASTFCSIHFAIYAAEYLSCQFHYEVIDMFIKGDIFKLRDKGGDEFKMLNFAIDQYLPGREGKDSNKGIYINLAKKIRERILGKGSKAEDWNKATPEHLQERYDYESSLSQLLRLGVVRDYEHLKELIDKL